MRWNQMGWTFALSGTGLLFMVSVSLAAAEPSHRPGDQSLIAAAERNDVEAVWQRNVIRLRDVAQAEDQDDLRVKAHHVL